MVTWSSYYHYYSLCPLFFSFSFFLVLFILIFVIIIAIAIAIIIINIIIILNDDIIIIIIFFSYKLYPQPCLHECAQAQHSPASHNCKLAARRRREEQVQLPCQHAQATTPPNEWPNKILSASTFVMAAHGTVQVLVYIMYENY